MELHIIFFILAGLLIAVLIGFSIWSARREKSNIFSNTFSSRPVIVPPPNNELNNNIPASLQPQANEYQAMSVPEENPQQIQQEVESSLQNIRISLPGEPQVQAVPPVQQPISEPVSTYGQQISNQQHIQNTPDFANPTINVAITPEQEVQVAPVEESEVVQTEQEENPFVTLYVYAPQNEPFRGDYVVHYLEEVGLRFGEHQIFHRHQHIDDSLSPIIFSAANLMNPGTFDLHNITNFSTAGLVLFMQLPTEGNDIVNMKLLLSNAEHLASSLGGYLYDDAQQPFSEESRQRYMQRVMH
ncbi:cell division protein ZipA [Mannheimia varigena]|uniref:Cell division protein ZipA n=1 Tax=Mannheimia varigena USDA-ARS-USMARC-1296 TaxID=1433287 RepID=W0Q9V6_9PAST|nr:cell division protein ZipA [Mannheimia varigena]AHG75082.1 Cell division protein ZipA [Mannheimia varigena USDA-ARS-USMARC-1296]AHG77209.1 Cell division protein ZipA [Mannheimia varigena USDA-ARS-USMARC-1312]TLU75212.1 cell division protein ZipA [Mannheimia varigena]